jgi:hypothetical protein
VTDSAYVIFGLNLMDTPGYSEMYFVEKYFPDFGTDDFDAAIVANNSRDRRFGVNSRGIK